jgi:hypothetical protein
MAMDDTDLYGFAADSPPALGGSLVKIPKTGGPATILVDAPNGIGAIFLDIATVYYSDSDSDGAKLSSVPKSGGTPHVYYDPGPIGRITGVALANAWLFWIELPDGSSLGNGTLLRRLAPLDVTATTIASSTVVFDLPVLVAGSSLYVGWYDGSASSIQWVQSGGSPAVFNAGANPVAMASDGQNLYWADTGFPRGLKGEPLAGGSVTSLVGPSAYAIAADDQYVYGTFMDASTGYVFRSAKAAGTSEHLVDFPQNMYMDCWGCLAADATDVYWARYDGVYRVAK